MPIQTHVENGCLVGFHPATNSIVRVPLSEIVEAAGIELDADERAALDRVPGGPTIVGAIEDALEGDVVSGKVGKKIKKGLKKAGKAIKKVAKNKIVKGLVNVLKKVTPPPFNIAITAAEGAAQFAKSLKKKGSKHSKIVKDVRAAAEGKITPAQLEARAKKAGVSPKEATDAAVIKRVALQSRTDPKAAAAMRLMTDMTSTEPAAQARALGAAAQAQDPGSQAYIVQTPGGRAYQALVKTGT